MQKKEIIRDSTYPPSDLQCKALKTELTGLAVWLMLRVIEFYYAPSQIGTSSKPDLAP